MTGARRFIVACALLATAATARAADGDGDGDGVPAAASAGEGSTPAAAAKPAWAFGLTANPYVVRGGQNFTSAVATADHGTLHLEARINYESIGARSVFVGVNWAGGDEIKWTLTPLVGGAWGTTQAFIPGFEADVAWRQLDLNVQGEFVIARHDADGNYFYAWSEFGWRPVEWLRVGLAGQRTRVYRSGLDLQRGPFAQVSAGAITVGAYLFNPGSGRQVFVGLIGATF